MFGVTRLNTSLIVGVIDICKASLRIHRNFMIRFIKRQVNSVVYLLIKMSFCIVLMLVNIRYISCIDIDIVIINEMRQVSFD